MTNAIITVNNIWCRLSGIRDLGLVDMLDSQLSYFVEGHKYMRAFTHGWYDKTQGGWRKWDGKRHLLTQRMIFPIGLLERVKEFLEFNGVPYDVDDKRDVLHGNPLSITAYNPRPYQIEAVEMAMLKGRGIIRVGTGGGKSPRIGTLILKYDGTICKVEELRSGDLLMGPDSRPRRVLSVNIQYGSICRISPRCGDPWYCNDEHILTLKHTKTRDIVDISIPEYKKQYNKFKHFKQFSVGVDFPQQSEPLPIDPYFLGICFGERNMETVTVDPHFKKIMGILGGGINNFRVPHAYLTSSRRDRLEFLAGWIDSGGYTRNNCYEITQKKKDWADAISFLARSLGFKVLVVSNKIYGETCYKINILGSVSKIPIRVLKKKIFSKKQQDPCETGFEIEPAGKDFFVGIELDGDGRFLLGDFTVTHNTLISSMLLSSYNVPSMVYVVGKDLLYQFHEDMVKCFGSDDIGIIGDGLCEVRKFNVCSIWTAAKTFEIKSKVSLDDEDWTPDIVDLDSAAKMIIKEAVQNARLAVFDEAHFLACDTIQSLFKAGKSCRYMFGLTGTDWRDDGADLLLESVCGKRIYDMSATKLINQGYLVPPKITLLEVPPDPGITRRMTWTQIYRKYITDGGVRNEIVVDCAKQLIKMGRKVLILVRYLKHGKNLVDMLDDVSVFFVNGELKGEKRFDIKRRFESGEIECLVASSVFDIGVDIPSLDALILAGGGKSTVRTLQRIGRAIRRGENDKKDAIIVDFIDNAKYLDKHSATRIAVYKTEQAFRIKFPKGFNRSRLKKPDRIPAKIK